MIRKLAIALLALGVTFSPIAAFAQNGNYDPCAVYPKQAVSIPSAAPTFAIALGVAGKAIYVCSVTTTQNINGTANVAAALTLWYGTATTATATPCGTNSPIAIATIGVFGSSGSATQYGAAGGTLGVVPAGAELCATTVGATFQGAVVTYVQIKQ